MFHNCTWTKKAHAQRFELTISFRARWLVDKVFCLSNESTNRDLPVHLSCRFPSPILSPRQGVRAYSNPFLIRSQDPEQTSLPGPRAGSDHIRNTWWQIQCLLFNDSTVLVVVVDGYSPTICTAGTHYCFVEMDRLIQSLPKASASDQHQETNPTPSCKVLPTY
jgi:hypothetical protein